MSSTEEPGYKPSSGERPSGWTIGFVVFAAVMMVLVGTFQVIAGIAAIFEDEFFVVGPNYVYDVDVTAWGWIHLILGLALVARRIRRPEGRHLGTRCRDHAGVTERDLQLLLHPVLPRVVDRDHRGRRPRDLGAVGLRSQGSGSGLDHARGASLAVGDEAGSPRACLRATPGCRRAVTGGSSAPGRAGDSGCTRRRMPPARQAPARSGRGRGRWRRPPRGRRQSRRP